MRRILILLLAMTLPLATIPNAAAKTPRAKHAKQSATAKSSKQAKAQKAAKAPRTKSAGKSKAKGHHHGLI